MKFLIDRSQVPDVPLGVMRVNTMTKWNDATRRLIPPLMFYYAAMRLTPFDDFSLQMWQLTVSPPKTISM